METSKHVNNKQIETETSLNTRHHLRQPPLHTIVVRANNPQAHETSPIKKRRDFESLRFIQVCPVLRQLPGELRVLGPPRLVPAEPEQGAIRDLRGLPVLLSLAELPEPELEPPLHLGDLRGVQAVPPLRQWYHYYRGGLAVLNASEFKNGPNLLHAHLPSLIWRGSPREEVGRVYSLVLDCATAVWHSSYPVTVRLLNYTQAP